MRRALAGVALAVTSMVALSFLIPLALLVQSEARGRATTEAEQRAAALAPVLALTTRPAEVQQAVSGLDSGGRLGVHLPGGKVIGAEHAPAGALARAERERETLALSDAAGRVYLQPVILDGRRVAVVESFVPRADLDRGVALSWVVMSLLAVGLVAGSVLVADRLGARVVRSSRNLSRASHALGSGDLDVRVEPAGPPELRELGTAFNSMADRVVQLLALERELVADLSHRLRTPLTALRLEAERIGAAPGAGRLTAAVTQLESELDSIISAARTPLAVGALTPPDAPPGDRSPAGERPEVAVVVRARVEFWSVLAGQQGRVCRLSATAEPTPVRLPHDDLAAVVDALIGNVFQHTPQGTAFTVRVERTAQAVARYGGRYRFWVFGTVTVLYVATRSLTGLSA
ncbi:HAMP domain-containing protein, partial [Streptomyces pathocidini]|uniref:HAMP domain-containing protein n=1 Tax=Streptomyces pathocidini TaxID=1650571 RepID=UPI0033F0BE45